jgi:hypothetical protein
MVVPIQKEPKSETPGERKTDKPIQNTTGDWQRSQTTAAFTHGIKHLAE